MDDLLFYDVISNVFGLAGSIIVVRKMVFNDVISLFEEKKDMRKERIELFQDIIYGTSFLIMSYGIQLFKLYIGAMDKISFNVIGVMSILAIPVALVCRRFRVKQLINKIEKKT